MIQMRITAIISAILSVALLSSGCSEEIPRISYLSPLNRASEGFLDQNTYQVIGTGFALDLSGIDRPYRWYLPEDISEDFTQQRFISFNEKYRSDRSFRRETDVLSLSDVLAVSWVELRKTEINLESLEEPVRSQTEAKFTLIENACKQARIDALLRWFDLSEQKQPVSPPENNPPEYSADTEDEERKIRDRFLYDSTLESRFRSLVKRAESDSIQFEVIEEKTEEHEKLKCLLILHIHKDNLLLKNRHLINEKS